MALLLYHRGFWSGLCNWFVELPIPPAPEAEMIGLIGYADGPEGSLLYGGTIIVNGKAIRVRDRGWGGRGG